MSTIMLPVMQSMLKSHVIKSTTDRFLSFQRPSVIFYICSLVMHSSFVLIYYAIKPESAPMAVVVYSAYTVLTIVSSFGGLIYCMKKGDVTRIKRDFRNEVVETVGLERARNVQRFNELIIASASEVAQMCKADLNIAQNKLLQKSVRDEQVRSSMFMDEVINKYKMDTELRGGPLVYDLWCMDYIKLEEEEDENCVKFIDKIVWRDMLMHHKMKKKLDIATADTDQREVDRARELFNQEMKLEFMGSCCKPLSSKCEEADPVISLLTKVEKETEKSRFKSSLASEYEIDQSDSSTLIIKHSNEKIKGLKEDYDDLIAESVQIDSETKEAEERLQLAVKEGADLGTLHDLLKMCSAKKANNVRKLRYCEKLLRKSSDQDLETSMSDFEIEAGEAHVDDVLVKAQASDSVFVKIEGCFRQSERTGSRLTLSKLHLVASVFVFICLEVTIPYFLVWDQYFERSDGYLILKEEINGNDVESVNERFHDRVAISSVILAMYSLLMFVFHRVLMEDESALWASTVKERVSEMIVKLNNESFDWEPAQDQMESALANLRMTNESITSRGASLDRKESEIKKILIESTEMSGNVRIMRIIFGSI